MFPSLRSFMLTSYPTSNKIHHSQFLCYQNWQKSVILSVDVGGVRGIEGRSLGSRSRHRWWQGLSLHGCEGNCCFCSILCSPLPLFDSNLIPFPPFLPVIISFLIFSSLSTTSFLSFYTLSSFTSLPPSQPINSVLPLTTGRARSCEVPWRSHTHMLRLLPRHHSHCHTWYQTSRSKYMHVRALLFMLWKLLLVFLGLFCWYYCYTSCCTALSLSCTVLLSSFSADIRHSTPHNTTQ